MWNFRILSSSKTVSDKLAVINEVHDWLINCVIRNWLEINEIYKKKCIWDNEKGGGIISTIDQTDRKKSFMSSQGEKYKQEFLCI